MSERPLVLVRGNPSAEELAAVLALLAARPAVVVEPAAAPRSPWSAPVLRRPLVPGPGAWRASGLPGH